MAPAETEFIHPKRATEIFKVEPGKTEPIRYLPHAEIGITCRNDDNETQVEIGCDPRLYTATKYATREATNGARVEIPGHVTLKDKERVLIASGLLDESLAVSHKKAPTRNEIGKITR